MKQIENKEYKYGQYFVVEREDGLWIQLYCKHKKPTLTQELVDRLDWDVWSHIYTEPGFIVEMQGPTFRSYLYAPLKN